MECNREDAITAKCMAENKMQSKDFVGARKLVLKAQQLFPDLENISQILTVCEVHCAAGPTVNGESDWYGILQVSPSSDESNIKKQYRKLALLLHPDKNKFPGAEAAFKLIGEAHRTLSDQAKRVLYDMNLKRGANFRPVTLRPTAQPPRTYGSSRNQPVVSSAQSNGPSTSQPPSSSLQTFWTICPLCRIRYQYYRDVLNKTLRCQNCTKPFIACDLHDQSVPLSANPTGMPQQKFRGPGAHTAAFRGGKSASSSQHSSRARSNSDIGHKPEGKVTEGCKVDRKAEAGNEVKFREKVARPLAGNSTRKRPKKIVIESSDSESRDSTSIDTDGGLSEGQNAGACGGSFPRRSTRQKQHVSYNEDEADDEELFSRPSKRLSKDRNDKAYPVGESNGISPEGNVTNGQQEKGEEGSSNGCGLSPHASVDVDSLSYPDPEFFDFEKERDVTRFTVNQIWAVYDDLDGMPRFYVMIKKVSSPNFQLRFTWLEYEPIGETETEWLEKELPVSCGNFKLGKSESIEETLMFSHLMPSSTGEKRNLYGIYPRKGEVWALFMNWDISWNSNTDNDRRYEYEIVEVLSDFVEGPLIHVVPLVKINGFVSLFIQAMDKRGVPSLEIPRNEILRFSHRIPSCRMNGEERVGVPTGSLELDTAALPTNFEKTCASISLESTEKRVKETAFC